MIDLHDKNICPTLDEIGQYVGNPVFMQFCSAIKSAHSCSEKIEFSACSWEHGWNIKFTAERPNHQLSWWNGIAPLGQNLCISA